MADPRVVRMAEIEVVPKHLDAYKAMLTEEIAASLEREPGVLMLHAVSLQSDPTHIRLLEVYASPEAYAAHIETPHFLKYKTGTAAMVTALRLIELDPILLAAKP